MNINIEPKFFNDIFFPHLENNARTQIVYGGAGSGKSLFLAQRTVSDILKGGRNYLVCRAVGNAIKKSVFVEITKVISNWGLTKLFKINKSDMIITCRNEQQIIFAGLDDPEKLKSLTPMKGVITDIWIEEATQIRRNDIKELNKRLRGMDVYSDDDPLPKRLTMSFNPILKSHWIYKEFFTKIMWEEDQTEYISNELTILKTWYIHNRFLTKEDIWDLENEEDEYYYQVYTLGNWGILGEVIFKKWKVLDLSKLIPKFDNLRHGVDFGFSNDPVCYIQAHLDKKRKIIYIVHEYYGLEVHDDELADEIKAFVKQDYLYCDEHEPKSISNLKLEGLKAIGAKKGRDSVRFGIKWLKGYTIIIHTTCVQFKQEIEQYQWKKNRYGDVMKEPVKKNDHGLDALRYAMVEDMDQRERGGFVKVKGIG